MTFDHGEGKIAYGYESDSAAHSKRTPSCHTNMGIVRYQEQKIPIQVLHVPAKFHNDINNPNSLA